MNETVKVTLKKYNSLDVAVDRTLVNSKRYHDKFDGLTESKLLNECLYQVAMKILEHRDGTWKEDVYALDSRTGEIILSITDCNLDAKVGMNREQMDTIKNYKGKLVLIHNHPSGGRPSLADIMKLRYSTVEKIIAVGHNGSVYVVSDLKEPNIDSVWKEAYNMLRRQHDKYVAMRLATDIIYQLDFFVFESR